MGSAAKIKSKLFALRKLQSKHPLLFAHVADCYLKLGSFSAAKRVLKKGIENFPAYPSGWVVEGQYFLMHNHPAKARISFKKVIELDPTNTYAHERCSEIAADFNDQNDYRFHIKAMSILDPLDDNIQRMRQAEELRQIAVNNGIFTLEEDENQMPGTLRRSLLRQNLLPGELRRSINRELGPLKFEKSDIEEYPEDDEVAAENTEGDDQEAESALESPPVEEEPIAYDDLKPVLGQESEVDTVTQTELEPDGIADGNPELAGLEDPSTYVEPEGNEAGSEDSSEQPAVVEGLETHAEAAFKLQEEVVQKATRKQPQIESALSQVIGSSDSEDSSDESTESPEAQHPEPESVTPQNLTSQSAEQESAEPLIPQVTEAQLSVVEGVKSELEDIAAEVTGVQPLTSKTSETDKPVASPPAPDPQKPRRIATKTLAELYASQGDWSRAINVYEELLARHPDNDAYTQRLEDLRSRKN